MDTLTIVLAVLGGFLAGVVNTLAGNGSAVTLSILTELLGLPGNLANGTNRVGVFLQTLASSAGFMKNGRYNILKGNGMYIVVSTIGALIGVYVALNVSNAQFKSVFKYLLLFTLLILLVNPKRWLVSRGEESLDNKWIAIPSFLILGFYGGFIQMGMGIFFLVVTVLIMRVNIIDANALKTLIIAVYTGIVLAIFHYNGMVDWKVGLIVASGQVLGGYLTADISSRYPSADKWAYRILVVVIIAAVISAFDLVSYIR